MSKIVVPADAELAALLLDNSWALYLYAPKPTGSFLWRQFKLMPAGDPGPKQRGVARTLYVHWNPHESRFARNAQILRWQAERPELMTELELLLSLSYGPEWLASEAGGGASAEDIAEELQRLDQLRRLKDL